MDSLAGVVHARRPQRLPVVLSRDEVRRVVSELRGSVQLAALLMYGSSKFNCVSKRQGRVDGSGNLRYDDHRLAFDVPIAETKFVLHLQDGQKIEFAATGAIKPKID